MQIHTTKREQTSSNHHQHQHQHHNKKKKKKNNNNNMMTNLVQLSNNLPWSESSPLTTENLPRCFAAEDDFKDVWGTHVMEENEISSPSYSSSRVGCCFFKQKWSAKCYLLVWGPVVWFPGNFCYERECYLKVLLESQSTGPQTTN